MGRTRWWLLAALAPVLVWAAPAGAQATPQQTVSVRLEGGYSYETSGPVLDGGFVVARTGAGVRSVHGAATVPGLRGGTARLGIDVTNPAPGWLPLAWGRITVRDANAGLVVDTAVLLGRLDGAGDTGATGSARSLRLWRLLGFLPYSVAWSVTEEESPEPPPPPPLPDADEGDFSALTYNVAGLIEPVSGSRPTLFSERISPLLNAYDLVLLQEDFFYKDLIARHLDHPYGSGPGTLPFGSDPSRRSAFVDDGLERYSRSPFDGYVRQRWPGCYGGVLPPGAADCLSQKGFSMARHHLAAGVTVDVYDLHAEAGSTAQDDHWRERDFEVLADFVLAHSTGNAVVVGGDMNLHIDTPADAAIWQELRDRTGLVDVCDDVDCSADPFVIDRFLYRSSSALELTPTSWAIPRDLFSTEDGTPFSDHDPVAVDFHWTRTG